MDMPDENQFEDGSYGNAPKLGVSKGVTVDKGEVVTDVSQAVSIGQNMLMDARTRVDNHALIERKLYNSRPYDPDALKTKGAGYMSNVGTGFMQSIVDLVGPRLARRVKDSTSLTATKVPPEFPNAFKKTEVYRSIVTQTIKRWRKFPFFLQTLFRETATFGMSFPAYTDDMEWRPKIFRQDQGIVPVGTEVGETPAFFLCRQDMRPEDLFEAIRDRVAAKEAGWDIDETVKAIERARPKNRDLGVANENVRQWESLERQMTAGYSYQKAYRVIPTWILFSQETDGTVSQRVIAYPEEKAVEVFYRKSRYESMDDVVLPFVYSIGDGTLYSSLGIGTLIYDLAAVVEKSRNSARDNLAMRGRFILNMPDERSSQRMKMSIFDNYVMVAGANFSGNTASLPGVVQEFIALDEQFRAYAQQKVGAFLPDAAVSGMSGGNPTATQIQINALKEQETKNIITDLALTQWQILVKMIERRMLRVGKDEASGEPVIMTADPEARRAINAMLDAGLTVDEIVAARDALPEETIIDYSEIEKQKVAAWAAWASSSQFFNQYKVAEALSTTQVGAELTAETMNPEGDPTNMTVQQHRQIVELGVMQEGFDIPILPDDNDVIHLEILKPAIQAAMQQGDQEFAGRLTKHYEMHFEAARQKGLLGDKVNEERAFQSDIRDMAKSQEQQAMPTPGGQLGDMNMEDMRQIPLTPEAQADVASGLV